MLEGEKKQDCKKSTSLRGEPSHTHTHTHTHTVREVMNTQYASISEENVTDVDALDWLRLQYWD